MLQYLGSISWDIVKIWLLPIYLIYIGLSVCTEFFRESLNKWQKFYENINEICGILQQSRRENLKHAGQTFIIIYISLHIYVCQNIQGYGNFDLLWKCKRLCMSTLNSYQAQEIWVRNWKLNMKIKVSCEHSEL